MAKVESLGITKVEALHYYVRDLDRSRRFYTSQLDFAEVGVSGDELTAAGKQRSILFEAGDCAILCSAPEGEGGRAWRWLRKHPDGVGSVIFRVSDVRKTFRLLEGRGGTPIDDIQTFGGGASTLETFSITTPFGGTTFRFVERHGFDDLFPGMARHPAPMGGRNRLGVTHIDHITSNFETLSPTILWLEHVMGFERFWDVQFHTDDVASQPSDHGSGLRSIVMWDPTSGAKFANNEPWRPFFRSSQINIFHEEQRGDGIQHAALAVKDILPAVREMRARGIEFMPTPATYYDMLPERLKRIGVGTIDENVAELRELGILVDGDADKSYLLQIFLKDSAGTHGDTTAGPFFYEVIQRKGDAGFGAGNFRALFESIEREQKAEGRA